MGQWLWQLTWLKKRHLWRWRSPRPRMERSKWVKQLGESSGKRLGIGYLKLKVKPFIIS